jgi:hypothetical protein
MTPVEVSRSIVKSIVQGVETSSRELQRQAPAARMVGEFAVKMLLSEARKWARSAGSPGVDHPRSASASEPTVVAPWPPPTPPET